MTCVHVCISLTAKNLIVSSIVQFSSTSFFMYVVECDVLEERFRYKYVVRLINERIN